MHVAGFNLVSVSLNFQFCQCQTQLSVSVSISFFRFWLYCIDSKLLLRYPYLSLSYAPWSEGGCLSSAKLRSTDSVNPRAVLSRVRPRYRPLLCVTSSLSWTSRCLVLVRPTVTRSLVLGHIYEKVTATGTTKGTKEAGSDRGPALRSTLPSSE